MNYKEKLEAYTSIQDNAQEIVNIEVKDDEQLIYIATVMQLFKEAIISVITTQNGDRDWEEQQKQTSSSTKK